MLESRKRGAGGFTLIELLIALAVLGILMGALGLMSLRSIDTYSNDSRTRVADATVARAISRQFAKDVQGASSAVTPGTCSTSLTGAAVLVSMVQSSDSSTVGWLYLGGTLYRSATCDGTAPSVVADGLTTATVSPSPASTTSVTLTVTRGAFTATMDGRSRLQTSSTPPGQTTVPRPPTTIPLDTPQFLALTGSTPLRVIGSVTLNIQGDAYMNKGSGDVAVDIDGNKKKLYITGRFGIQSGATCNGCDDRTVDGYAEGTKPFTYNGTIPDPYGWLPAPAPGAVQTTCPMSGSVRICQPGVYNLEFPPDGNTDYQLMPGVYTLRAGLDNTSTNTSLTGTGVLIYNEVGQIKFKGGDLDLQAPTSGVYTDVLFFQPRTNQDAISIGGNGTISTLDGIIYAPASTKVGLAGGRGQLRVGAIVSQSMEISGTGDVYVNLN